MRTVARSCVLAALVLALTAAVTWGEEPVRENGVTRWDGAGGAWEKAGRGISNVTLGFVVEWPKTVLLETEAHGPLFGLTVGLIKGMGLGVGRTFVGIYELVTFPLPNGSDYAPVLEPGTPFSTARTERFIDTPIR
ncbi:MAG: exosortase system-associated protein, TIGR04073 family [Candidatus Methylomirabilales bacterium]